MSRSSASDTSDSLGEDSQSYRRADHNNASTTPTPGNATPLGETEGSGVDSGWGFSTQAARASRAPKFKANVRARSSRPAKEGLRSSTSKVKGTPRHPGPRSKTRIEGQNQPKLISRVTGDEATIVKLQQAGYEHLASWETKVREIECVEYSGGVLKWHWISIEGLKMRSTTRDMVRMCPKELTWYIEDQMRQSLSGNALQHKVELKLVLRNRDDEVTTEPGASKGKGKERAL